MFALNSRDGRARSRVQFTCKCARAPYYARCGTHTYTHTQLDERKTSLHRTHLLDLSHDSYHHSPSSPSSMWPLATHGNGRKYAAPSRSILFSSILSAYHSFCRARFTKLPSGWAARHRARTRPVHVTARHTHVHNNGTATPPFVCTNPRLPTTHDGCKATIPCAPLCTADSKMRPRMSGQ